MFCLLFDNSARFYFLKRDTSLYFQRRSRGPWTRLLCRLIHAFKILIIMHRSFHDRGSETLWRVLLIQLVELIHLESMLIFFLFSPLTIQLWICRARKCRIVEKSQIYIKIWFRKKNWKCSTEFWVYMFFFWVWYTIFFFFYFHNIFILHMSIRDAWFFSIINIYLFFKCYTCPSKFVV